MQTIEEKAKEYENQYGFNSEGELNSTPFESFKAGVEFAQKWINVDVELPITNNNEKHYGVLSNFVICKFKNGKYNIARLFINIKNEIYWIDSNGNLLIDNKVISWRPIELK